MKKKKELIVNGLNFFPVKYEVKFSSEKVGEKGGAMGDFRRDEKV